MARLQDRGDTITDFNTTTDTIGRASANGGVWTTSDFLVAGTTGSASFRNPGDTLLPPSGPLEDGTSIDIWSTSIGSLDPF